MALSFAEVSTPAALNWISNDVCWASGFGSAGMFILVGDRSSGNDRVITTEDCSTFTVRTGPTTTGFWRGVAYSPSLNRAVMVGQGGIAGWSNDGITWANATGFPPANNWQSVCWWDTHSIFVAVSNNGVNRVATSTDGKTWTAVAAASALSWRCVRASGGAVVALARVTSEVTQFIMRATDSSAATWALVTTAAYSTQDSSDLSSSGIAYSADLGMLVLSAQTAASGRVMLTSVDDGATWTEATIPTPTDGKAVWGGVWAGEQFLVARWVDFKYLTSSDGSAWTQTSQSSPPSDANYATWAWSPTLRKSLSGSRTSNACLALVVTSPDLPTLTSLSPAFGTYHGGTVVTITGTGLSSVTSVTFGGTAAVSVVATDTAVTCVTPPHVVGLFDVVVDGVGTFTNGYSFVGVTHVSPKSGTVAGSTAVTVTGFGFNAATGVLFDTDAATSMVLDPTTPNLKLTCVTPAHAAGVVDVTVSGVDVGAHLYTYTLPVPQQQGKGPLLPPIPTRRTS